MRHPGWSRLVFLLTATLAGPPAPTAHAHAQAQEPALIPREALFGNPEHASPQLSPDGTRLAYLAPDSGVMNIWVRTLSPAGPPDDRPVTRERRRPIRHYAWQGDSRHVLYLQDHNGNEQWHLYQTDVDSLDTRDLTPFDRVQTRIVALDPNHPTAMVIALNRRHRALHDAYRLDLVTGALTLQARNPGDVLAWTADNRLRVRVAQAVLDDGIIEYRLRDRDRLDAPWRVIRTEAPSEVLGRALGFARDNRRLFLLSSVGAATARVLEIDTKTGATHTVASDPHFDIRAVLRHPRRRAIDAVNVVRHASEWDLVDTTLRAAFDTLRAVRPAVPNIVSRDLPDRQWIVRYDAFGAPAWYYRYERRTGTVTPLFADRPALRFYRFALTRPFTYRSSDGMTIHGFLTLPPGKAPRNLPLVVLAHDGPWSRDVWGNDAEVQFLANRGYAVLQVNFRGSSGYGKAYLGAGDREWGGMIVIDLLDGKNWAVDQGYADPARACIWGKGFGGYAALMAVALTPDDFRCAIDMAGPTNLLTLLQELPPYLTRFRYLFAQRMDNMYADPVILHEHSPLFKAGDILAPLLIVHGANDPRVPLSESAAMVDALREHDKAFEYLVFPHEGHDLLRPANRLRFYAEVEAFLAKHLKGRAEAGPAVTTAP